MKDLLCLCDNRTDIVCNDERCEIAGPGEPGNPNQCRVCWLRLKQPHIDATATVRPATMPKRLGDMVQSALAKVGITEERVSRWLGRPCGCKERREKLNALHTWASKVLFGGSGKAEESLGEIIDDGSAG